MYPSINYSSNFTFGLVCPFCGCKFPLPENFGYVKKIFFSLRKGGNVKGMVLYYFQPDGDQLTLFFNSGKTITAHV